MAVEVIKLWQLPDNFFQLETNEEKFDAIKAVTHKAENQSLRRPCRLSRHDDLLASSFFLVTLGFPILLSIYFVYSCIQVVTNKMEIESFLKFLVAIAFLSFHPLPKNYSDWRHTRLALALIRYFSYEIIIDRSKPFIQHMGTINITLDQFDKNVGLKKNPLVMLACPHGVFNYGAILWCCVSYWIIGREQYTGAAGVVKYVPGLRYMDPIIWAIDANRQGIKKVLQKPLFSKEKGEMSIQRGAGMLGMVPDGILGAFRCRQGVDELVIGKKRGLMRICQEEGAIVFVGWFFGTTDMLTVVTDRFGIMEFISRKLKAGMLLFYGRWFLPIPRRIAVTLSTDAFKCQKLASPTKDQVELVHVALYDRLKKVYEEQKRIAGYADRSLNIT